MVMQIINYPIAVLNWQKFVHILGVVRGAKGEISAVRTAAIKNFTTAVPFSTQCRLYHRSSVGDALYNIRSFFCQS